MSRLPVLILSLPALLAALLLAASMLLSAVFGVIGAVGGIVLSHLYGYAPGPAFVLVAGVLFFGSIVLKK